MNTKYVPSLELCKQLKEAGWEKETEFYWVAWDNNYPHSFNLSFQPSKTISYELNKIPAPLSDEILKELPKDILVKKVHYRLVVFCGEQDYTIHYLSSPKITFQDKSLPNALAKCLLYLIKNGIISLKGD